MHNFYFNVSCSYIKAGIKEIHVLFDDEGQLPDHVKSIKRSRRDSLKSDNSHEHFEAVNDAELPSKWRQIISCQVCKLGLITSQESVFTHCPEVLLVSFFTGIG